MDIADGGIGIEVGRTAIENLLQDLGIGAGAHDALSLFITDGCQDTGVFIKYSEFHAGIFMEFVDNGIIGGDILLPLEKTVADISLQGVIAGVEHVIRRDEHIRHVLKLGVNLIVHGALHGLKAEHHNNKP